MVGQTVSHYRILSKLGEGGMGVVYLAEDENLGRKVAVKFCSSWAADSQQRRSILSEARAASALAHPHIAHIYEYGETAAGEPFIVMELVSGRNLSQVLRENPPAVNEAVAMVKSVAGALAEAHRNGVIHRDIKPGNIRIDERGEVKVLDFGIARQLRPQDTGDVGTAAPTATIEGAIRGTPPYMSPEQARGKAVDSRSDLFSLGVVLYECLTGKSPFAGGATVEVLARVIEATPPAPSTLNRKVPRELDRITMKLLAKQPEARYRSADELLGDLERLPAGGLTRRRLAVWALAAAALVLAVIAIRQWGRGAPYKPSPEALRWYREGTSALSDGTAHKASKALLRAIQIDPRYALAHARLADAWTELDYADRAKEEMLKAMPPGLDLSAFPRHEALYLEAIHLTVTGDLAGAVARYEEMARLAPASERVTAQLDLGRAYERNEDLKNALKSYSEAARLDPQSAAALLRLAVLQSRQRDYAGAAGSFDRAESLYQAASSVEGVTEAMHQRAVMLNRKGERAQARELLDKVFSAAKVTGNEQQQIRALMQASSLSITEGKTGQAQQEARRAVELARASGIENLTTRALIDLGIALHFRGDKTEARNYYQQALVFARRYMSARNEARALVNLGSLQVEMGETDAGWADVERALKFYRQGGYGREAALAMVVLGRAMRQKGDPDAALRAFEQALASAKPLGDSSEAALSEEGIGSVRFGQERLPEALLHYREGRRIYTAIGNRMGAGFTASSCAGALWRLGRFVEAGEFFDEAMKIAGDGGYRNLEAAVLRSRAEMAAAQGRDAESRALARKALSLVDPQDAAVIGEIRRVTGLALARSGRAREGRSSCQQAMDAALKQGNPGRVADALLVLAEVALESGDRAAARDFASRARGELRRLGRKESEFRAGALLAKAGDAGAGRNAASVLVELERLWGADNFRSYLGRPDVRRLRGYLNQFEVSK